MVLCSGFSKKGWIIVMTSQLSLAISCSSPTLFEFDIVDCVSVLNAHALLDRSLDGALRIFGDPSRSLYSQLVSKPCVG